ncbi:MAG: hypothetical protein ACPGOY_09770 [Rhodospirillaceae bacterium]
MSDLPEWIQRGEKAQLFPALEESNKERRVTSIFLALLPQIPALAQEVLSTLGHKLGKRATIETYIEVNTKSTKDADRPDGLIVVNTGRTVWTALIETKIGKAKLDLDQIERYLKTAKDSKIDAVITISNKFVTRAHQSPVPASKQLLRSVNLFHWSWTYLATVCEILRHQNSVVDPEQAFLLNEFLRFLSHPSTGIERFSQMPQEWKEVCEIFSSDGTLKKSDPKIEAVIACWGAEERDICLQLSSLVGMHVTNRIERKYASDLSARQKDQAVTLAEDHLLASTIIVPNCASDIQICVDLRGKKTTISMTLKAPGDRKSSKARLNWLLRMLPLVQEKDLYDGKENEPSEEEKRDHKALLSEQDNIYVRAKWIGRAAPTQFKLLDLVQNPELIQAENPDLVPTSFEVLLSKSTNRRFIGRKTFVEDLETGVLCFYKLVASRLKAWQAPPPQPIKAREDADQSGDPVETAQETE